MNYIEFKSISKNKLSFGSAWDLDIADRTNQWVWILKRGDLNVTGNRVQKFILTIEI
jgi:hypothetical protein